MELMKMDEDESDSDSESELTLPLAHDKENSLSGVIWQKATFLSDTIRGLQDALICSDDDLFYNCSPETSSNCSAHF